MMQVTPELIQKAAQEYLRQGNRTIFVLEAGAGEANAEVANNE